MPALRNTQHELLCWEFLTDFNQTQAAIRAGYSAKTATIQAAKLFKNPQIRARRDELLADRSKRVGVTADRVVVELARIAFMKTPDVVNLNDATVTEELTDDDKAVISAVKIRRGGAWEEREIRMFDKLRALELLGKHLGMFTENTNVNVNPPKIVDDIRE